MRSCKIGLVQTVVVEDKMENLRNAAEQVKAAARMGGRFCRSARDVQLSL